MIDNQQINGGGYNRVIGLDILRIAMAFLIYLFHSNCHLGCTYSFMTDFISVGAIAMVGFFMLSGYALNLSYGGKDLGNWTEMKSFYLKRFIAIYPLYIVVGTLFVLMMTMAGKQTVADNIILIPIEVLGMQSLFTGALFSYAHNGGTWFVSCLFLCYLLFPIIMLWTRSLTKQKRNVLLMVLIGLLVGIPIVAHRFNEPGMYTNPFYRTIEFMVGIVLSQLNENAQKKQSSSIVECSVLISFTLVLLVGISLFKNYRPMISELCFPVIIFCIARIPFKKLQQSKVILYLSAISYAFFLAQFFVWNPLKFLMLYTGRLSNYSLIAISLVACVVISILLHELVEKKASKYLKLKLLN